MSSDNPVASNHYDLIVIGSGQAGNPLSAAFAAAGKRVAVIERALVGGTCVNYGCTPTKAMVASAEVAHLAGRAADFGLQIPSVSVDMKAVVARKDRIVENSRSSNEKKLHETVELVRGEASFTGPKAIHVTLNQGGTANLTAETIVIDTGLSPAPAKLDGIETVTALDNVSIMQLQEIPEHLVVLGGGYIGLEFAQMFRRFGSAVTIIQDGTHLLDREDDDIADAVADILREDGLTVLLNSRAIAVKPESPGFSLTVEAENGNSEIKGTHLLIATGRKPNTVPLKLEAAGIATDEHGFIQVNERLQTSVPGVYAVGDVKGGPAFTHIAYDDYRILQANLLHGESRVTTGRPVPYCVFIDPELGRIGMNEQQAKEAGQKYRIACMPMTSSARGVETGQTRGFMKALVDPDTKQVLGAAILGAQGGEIMSMLQIAMMGKIPYPDLQHGIFAHPLYAEALNNLFATLDA